MHSDVIKTILSNPACTMEPEWFEEAISMWIDKNMGRFLRKNQFALETLIDRQEYVPAVAEAIHISAENRPMLSRVLQTLSSKHLGYAGKFCKRLVLGGLTDIVLNGPDELFVSGAIVDAIHDMQSTDIIQVIKRVDWSTSVWTATNLITAVRSLKPHEMDVFVKRYSNDGKCFIDNIGRIVKKAIVKICQRLPLQMLLEFCNECEKQISPFTCMDCGIHNFKSEESYASHRQRCDPNNFYPRVGEILAARMSAGE